MGTVTREQALAFVRTIVAWEPVENAGDEAQRPVSPRAFSHVEAVLGLGKVPNETHLFRALGRGSPLDVHGMRAMAEYLRDVSAALLSTTPEGQNP